MTEMLKPVASERVETLLKEMNYSYGRDDENDLMGLWDGNVFYFLAPPSGDLLQIMSFFRHDFAAQHEEQLRDFIDEWHRTKYWPRLTMLRVGEDESELRIRADHGVHYEHGASDEQLRLQINCALQTALRSYSALTQTFGLEFPEPGSGS
ncbi:YbjN domain-containing protein [Leucobacter sp. OH2974_COT-288]|uniref:YbjN domain-containing protein n=1 Tax=Canibacter oris TaxID=1365628 RepID=A0A840DSQ5_9MICO|nr:YbjN domain-containing protein [Canibacter oris]MBB4072166.1 hypothetical protein [Canibacter oris]RRD35620.1 YbjN domain-containing protein [Leucobacter sp. OH2974_COT-288]